MTRIEAAIIGSGTLPYTRGILPPSQRGVVSEGKGERQGIQTVVANPEDFNSVDAFTVSGVSIGTVPVKIWGPGINPLPRQRAIIMHNEGPGIAYIGPNSTSVIAPSGMTLHITGAAQGVIGTELPFMHNVDIWARSTTTSQIRIIAY